MGSESSRFVGIHVVGLAVSGLLLLWLSRNGAIDFWFAWLFFDPAVNQFPLKEAPLFALLGHTGLKWFAVAVWLVAIVLALIASRAEALRAWRAPLVSAVVSALTAVIVVSLLKAVSPHSCPWDLIPFGGKSEWFALLDAASANPGPGRCWPAGHASGGFALIAGYFALRDRHVVAARMALIAALVLGGLMAAVQMALGAHFLSHNLWTLWITWTVCLMCYFAFQRFLVARVSR